MKFQRSSLGIRFVRLFVFVQSTFSYVEGVFLIRRLQKHEFQPSSIRIRNHRRKYKLQSFIFFTHFIRRSILLGVDMPTRSLSPHLNSVAYRQTNALDDFLRHSLNRSCGFHTETRIVAGQLSWRLRRTNSSSNVLFVLYPTRIH